jgi:Tol biopolymer transport system component
MTLFDLQRVVPEPPDDLLDLRALESRIRRRQLTRRLAAAATTVAVVVGTVIGGIAITGSTSPRPLSPVSHLDGRLVFGQDTTQVTKTNLLADTSLYSVDPTAGQTQRLTHEADGIDFAVASPDGRRIAYSQETYGYGPAGHPTHINGAYVHVANADGSDDQRIYSCPTSSCEELVWSPDSERLLINGDHVLGPDGRVRRLCVGHCSVRSTTYDASWSPDGQRLAFQYWKDVPLDNGRSGPAGVSTVQAIGVMNADGSRPELITDQD